MAPYQNRVSQPDFASVVGQIRPSVAFIVLIFGALIAFEMFNYSTTDHALSDLLGDLAFLGLRWSTILAVAFCGIDFAGIARLFTPEQGANEPKEVWYLFVAWLLAATMNAVLTWWGVSMAVMSHTIQSSTVVDAETVSYVVPVFVAVLVWLIRILIIGTLSISLERFLAPAGGYAEPRIPRQQPMQAAPMNHAASRPASFQSASTPSRQPTHRPSYTQQAVRPQPQTVDDPFADLEEEPTQPARSRNEPSYHTLSMRARSQASPPPDFDANNGPSTSSGQTGTNRARRM